jgi:hypothetical protein
MLIATQETVNMPKSAAKKRRSTKDIFGRAAPSKNLRLPQDLNILVAEIVVYIPNSMRNYHLLLRLVQAGLDQKTIANIVNSHRFWEKYPAMPNSLCHMLKTEMRKGLGGKKDWTVTKHSKGHLSYDYEWDEEDLTLNGIILNCEVVPTGRSNGTVEDLQVENIPFAELALNVRVHPSYKRGDGFILTRCVQYAAAHPEKEYLFPRDFAHLAQKLDDGRELTADHLDAASITRWKIKDTWAYEQNPDTETFGDVEESDDEADEVDVTMEEGQLEDFADLQEPLDFPTGSITGQEDTLEGSFNAHRLGSYRDFAPHGQSVAGEDTYAADRDSVDPCAGHDQSYDGFSAFQFPHALVSFYPAPDQQAPQHNHTHLSFQPGYGQRSQQPGFQQRPQQSVFHQNPQESGFHQHPQQSMYSQLPQSAGSDQLHHRPGWNQLHHQQGWNQLAQQPDNNQPPSHPYNSWIYSEPHHLPGAALETSLVVAAANHGARLTRSRLTSNPSTPGSRLYARSFHPTQL